MIHVFVGFFFAWVLRFIHRLLYPHASPKRQEFICFIILTLYSSYLTQTYENIWITIAVYLLLFVCLHDYTNTSVPIVIPVWLSLCFYFFDGNPYSLLLSLIFFLLIWLIDFLWDKYISENFDLFFLFPLLFLPFFEKNMWIPYLVFLCFIFIARISKETWIGEGDAYFLLPILFFFPYEDYIAGFLLSAILALPFALWNQYKKEPSDFPYTPYLLGGFLITYHTNALVSLSVLGLSFLSSIGIWFYFRFFSKEEKEEETIEIKK